MSAAQASFAGSISEAEFGRVQWALLPAWLSWHFFAPICVLGFIALGVGWSEAIAEPLRAVPDVLLGLAVFGASMLLTRYGHRRAWKNYIRLHGAVSGRVGPQGMEWKTELSTVDMPWEKLLGYRKAGDLVLLYYAPRCAFFLPRTFFANEQEWVNLQDVLARHSKTR